MENGTLRLVFFFLAYRLLFPLAIPSGADHQEANPVVKSP
ncbi:MAG: hypothetical protein JWN14_235 [Chthonomonadales bacterium]|nr:hypothetical protein [Chthonomonadales bacterium]